MTAPTATPPTDGEAAPRAHAATPAIRIRGLCHTYPAPRRRRSGAVPAPDRAALSDVDLEVETGEIFGLLGPNGSGKTTLFRVVATLMTPSAGEVEVLGRCTARQPGAVRRSLGVLFQSPSLDSKLTARENLDCHGRLYGLAAPDLPRRIDALLEQVGLAGRDRELVQRFSGGMQRRLELAKALLSDPRVLVLDEPSTGLDPGARHDMWKLLKAQRRRGATIVLTTHLMEEAERCDRLGIIAEGRMVAVDAADRLRSRVGGDVVSVEPKRRDDLELLRTDIEHDLGPWHGDGAPRVAGGRIRLETGDGSAFVARLGASMADRIRGVAYGRPTLEDVYLKLTGHEFAEPE